MTISPEMPKNRPAPWEGVALVFVQLMFLFTLAVVYGFIDLQLGLGDHGAIYFLLVGEALLIIPLVVWIYKRRLPWRETFRIYPTRWQLMGLGLVIAVLAWPIASVVSWPFEWLLSQIGPAPDLPTPQTTAEKLAMGVSVVILAPLVEEPIFRGFIIRGWLRFGALWAILASGILFGLQHGQLADLFGLILVGLILGVVSWRSGSILPAIVIHSVFNLISFMFLLQETEPVWLNNLNLLLVSLLALPALLLVLAYVYRTTTTHQETFEVQPRSKADDMNLVIICSLLVLGMFALFGLFDLIARWASPELLGR